MEQREQGLTLSAKSRPPSLEKVVPDAIKSLAIRRIVYFKLNLGTL